MDVTTGSNAHKVTTKLPLNDNDARPMGQVSSVDFGALMCTVGTRILAGISSLFKSPYGIRVCF